MHVVRKGVFTLLIFSLAFLSLLALPRGIYGEANTSTAGDWGEELFGGVL